MYLLCTYSQTTCPLLQFVNLTMDLHPHLCFMYYCSLYNRSNTVTWQRKKRRRNGLVQGCYSTSNCSLHLLNPSSLKPPLIRFPLLPPTPNPSPSPHHFLLPIKTNSPATSLNVLFTIRSCFVQSLFPFHGAWVTVSMSMWLLFYFS